MKLRYTIKCYHTGGAKEPFRVQIDVRPRAANDRYDYAEGKGDTEAEAYAHALSKIKSKPALEKY